MTTQLERLDLLIGMIGAFTVTPDESVIQRLFALADQLERSAVQLLKDLPRPRQLLLMCASNPDEDFLTVADRLGIQKANAYRYRKALQQSGEWQQHVPPSAREITRAARAAGMKPKEISQLIVTTPLEERRDLLNKLQPS